MKVAYFLLVGVLMTGCANWTPEQHQNFSNALQQFQNNQAMQQQQNIQMMQAMPPPRFGTTCVTRPSFGQMITTCD